MIRRAMATRARNALLAFVALLAAAMATVVLAAPAQASPDGWVYLVIQNRNCPGGGSINYVQGTVSTTYTYRQLWNGGDGGDNIVYPKVELNQSNTFTGRAFCANGNRSAWINIYREFVPRGGQTVWL